MAEEKIKKLLDQFERNKEWADLVNWLNKINEALKTPGLKRIPSEEILAKRLSQCLNQTLPNSVHILTLDTYGLIFQFHCGSDAPGGKPIPWGNSLAFYSPGLFSFYQFAKLEVKIKFNELIKNSYLRLGSEILSCLNGLLSILLLGLDDQNEDALKGIDEILQGLERKIGTRMFYGTIWLAILRTSKIRYPALKFLIKSIPSTAEEFPLKRLYKNEDAYKVSNIESYTGELKIVNTDSEKPISEEELLYYFYPQKESLVVNAVIQCLEDDLVFTQRCTFDFLTSHMPLQSDILSHNEKVCIVEAGCYLLLKKNDTIIRRLYSWVLGHAKSEEGTEAMSPLKTDIALKVFIKAMQNLFKTVPEDAKSAKAPLQIVKTIFDDNEGLTERLLPEIASTIVKYLEMYKEGRDFSEELSGFGAKFLSTDIKHLILIWQALGSELSELMGEHDYKKVLQTINLIKFFLKTYNASTEKFSNSSKYLKPIFDRILMSMNSLSNNLECMENTIPGLKLISEIMLIFEKETGFEKLVLMGDGITKFVQFYSDFITSIMKGRYEKDEESWKFVEEAFFLATRNVVALQVYVVPDNKGTKWLSQMIECIESPTTLCEITVICIEGIISIYEKQKEKLGCDSYRYLQNCIKKEPEIITKLWDMIGQSPNDRKVVELVMRADSVIPLILASCVINKLLDERMSLKIAAVNQFALFWKLASEYFPTFVPFSSEPLCLFHMIDFLNHDHPLVRHSSKNWLAESSRKLDRILDPIISRLLKKTSDEICNTATGQLVYTAPYDTRLVVDAFKRLRSIFQANKSELMRFMMEKQADSELLQHIMKEKAKELCDIVRAGSTYLQVLLFLSIKYIRGEVGEVDSRLKQQFITENAAVNACGCEFIELLLTNVEPSERSPEVASWVIQPLLQGLKNTFISNDNVMQVEILKIVRLIQINCLYHNKQYAENCLAIFNNKEYFEILHNGLESKVSYVRSYYISYVKSTLNFFTVFTGERLENCIIQIVGYLKNNLAKCSSMSTTRTTEGNLIANENDVLQILSGIKTVVHHYFFEADAVLDREELIELQKFNNPQAWKKNKEYVERTRNTMLDTIGELLIKGQRIWKLSKPKVVKDFKLTHIGILPFTNKCYSDTLDMYYKEGFTFESVSKGFTSYQEAIIKIMTPVVIKYPNQTIRSVLNIWLNEHYRNNDEALRKIIDILVSLQVPLEDVISGIITNLESAPDLKLKKSPAKGSIEVSFPLAWREASTCLFLYSYLVYTYDWYNKDKKAEDKIKSLKSIWTNLVKLFKLLMVSRSPTTLCWLYDIMYLTGTKYDPRDIAQQERKIRKSIEDVIGQLTTDTALISVTQNGLVVDDHFALGIAYNPSIYEQLMSIEIPEEKKENCTKETELLSLKLKELMPQFGRRELGGDKTIQGTACYFYLRGFCFLTLREKLYESTEKMLGVTNKDKMSSVLNTVMASLFPLIAQRDNQFGECAADVLFSILRTKDEYIAFRKQIVEIFLSDNFFVVDQRSLKKWKLILNWLLTFDKNELFMDLITQLSAKGTLLTSKAYELTRKYQALKRLGFLILSGVKDHFDECYALLLTKFMEGIRDADNLTLVAQYLTLLRVMFLRFSQLNEPVKETAKNMQTLWPNLLCKLIQIFQDSESKQKQYTIVILAALRVLEIMSVLNIEDHTLFQWVFVVDSFGWKVLANDLIDDSEPKPILLKNEGQGFVPFCFNILSAKFTATFMNEAEGNDRVEMGESLHHDVQDRRLIFTKNTGGMMEITQSIIKYICYLSMKNVTSTKLDLAVIEEQVEKDFISEGSDTIS